MRTKVSLLAALFLLALPASGQAVNATRQVATKCDSGRVRAWAFNPTATRLTEVGCPSWTFYQNGKFVTWNRPIVDIEAAGRSAKVWWPKCQPEWYGVNDNRSTTGYYYTFFRVCV